MKRFLKSWGGIILVLIAFMVNAFGRKQQTEPWAAGQLLDPSVLAKAIGNDHAIQSKIFCVGPGALIPNSIDTGPAKDKQNLDKLRIELSKLPRDANVIIYCGCCPFERCPNVRPAFSLLNEMKFTRAKLLNIPHNLKTDWIDKGYPVTN